MIIVLTGPMGCGKTTVGKLLARRLGCRFADGDDYHPPENIAKMKAGIPLDDDDRRPWLTDLGERLQESAAKGEDLILACSALKNSYRRLLGIDQQIIHSVFLKGRKELLSQRVAVRFHEYMNSSLLDSQLEDLEEPEHGLIVSIEGTPEEIVQEILDNHPTLQNRK